MAGKVSPIPESFHTLTPHLVVRGVAKAIGFYQKAFGADELYRNVAPDGSTIIHSELMIGDSRFFLNDELLEQGLPSPSSLGGSPVTLHLYVEDVDTLYNRAVAAGAEVLLPLDNYFWGDRYAILKDPFGHRWSIASRLEDLSPQEVQERARKYYTK